MNTDEIMDLALRMVGFEAIPADSEIYVPGNNISKVLFGIDIGSAELLMAKDQGYDVVISHPLDELGRIRVAEEIARLLSVKRDATVADVMASIRTIAEFQEALTEVKLGHGGLSNKAGKTVFSHAAYTNGGYEVAKTYYKYGIDTVIYIHISEADLAKLRADGVGNLIVTGHMASDSVGINPFIAELRRRGVTVDAIGGIISGQ